MAISKTEVNLRRLLYKCDMAIQSGLGEEFVGRRKLLHFVQEMRNYLANLEKQAGNIPSEKARFLELARRIDKIEDMLDVAKMSVPLLVSKGQTTLVETTFISQSELNRASQSELVVKNRKQTKVRDELFLTPQQEERISERNELFNSDYNNAGKERGEDFQKKISLERHVQEQLTDEMVRMAQYLKQNALGIERIAHDDDEILTKNEKIIESNLTFMQRQNKKLKEFTSKSGFTTIYIWIMILIVLCLFVTTFIMIRILPKQQ